MAEAIAEPTSGQPTDAGTGGTPSGDNGSGTGGGPDFRSRIRSDPDFAVEQVTNHQSRADREAAARAKAEEKLQSLESWLGPLSRFQGQLDGNSLDGFIQDLGTLLQHPDFEKLVMRDANSGRILGLRGGSRPSTSEGSDVDDEDEYLSPEQKEIRQLREQNQTLASRLNRFEANTGMKALTEHLEGWQREWQVPPDAFERVRKGLIEQVKQWQAQGPVGQKALENLSDAEIGPGTVASLAMRFVTKADLRKSLEEEDLRRQKRLAGMATDGPPPAPGDPGVLDPAEFKNDPVKALLAARAHPERNSSL